MRKPTYDYRITDYDRSILPSRFLAFLEESVEDPEDWVSRSGRSLGHPGWGLVYHLVLSTLDPGRDNLIVETGTNLGSTAIIIAQAIADSGRSGLLRTVELDPQIQEQAVRRITLSGVGGYVESYLGDSLQTIPVLVKGDVPVALAFLDGNHFHDHVVTEFELVHPHLRDDAIVVFDNTFGIAEADEDPRVNGALRTIMARFGGNLINLPFCSWYTPGIALWQQQPFPDMRPPEPGSFIPEKSG